MIDVGVNELILALRLHHVVSLFSQAPNHPKDGQLDGLGERIACYNKRIDC